MILCDMCNVQLSYEILKQNVEFEKEDWEHVSKDSIKLVSGLLDKNPNTRSTLDDILKLAWLKTSEIDLVTSGKYFRQKFRGFVIKRKKQRMMSTPGLRSSSNNNHNNNGYNNGYNYRQDPVMQLTLPLHDRDSMLIKQDNKK